MAEEAGVVVVRVDRQRLLEIAERCPVHRTLVEEKEIVSRLV